MTRDEHRKACIEAMATATARMRGYNLTSMTAEWLRNALILEATAALDALHELENETRFSKIEADLLLLKWMVAVNTAVSFAIAAKLFLH